MGLCRVLIMKMAVLRLCVGHSFIELRLHVYTSNRMCLSKVRLRLSLINLLATVVSPVVMVHLADRRSVWRVPAARQVTIWGAWGVAIVVIFSSMRSISLHLEVAS